MMPERLFTSDCSEELMRADLQILSRSVSALRVKRPIVPSAISNNRDRISIWIPGSQREFSMGKAREFGVGNSLFFTIVD
jgi:hypothetical protein